MVVERENLKQVELNLLTNFLAICEKENLRYYLIGGSCIGAIRHKGFIPWDDDIDVGMPRPDYERFLTCAQMLLPDYIFLQTYCTDSGYLNNFAKLRDCNTTFVETSCKNLVMNHGIYIDIFPIDGAGNDKKSIEKQMKEIFRYSRPINEQFYCPNEPPIQRIKRMIKRIIYPFIFPSISKCLEKREKIYKKYEYDKSDYVVNYGGAWGKKEIVPSYYFGKGCVADFENLKVIVPEKYDLYLSNIYGDYMTPPPPEKRFGHHYSEIIDTKKSYIEYFGSYK